MGKKGKTAVGRNLAKFNNRFVQVKYSFHYFLGAYYRWHLHVWAFVRSCAPSCKIRISI